MISWFDSLPSSFFYSGCCPLFTMSAIESEEPGVPLMLSDTFFDKFSSLAAAWSRFSSFFSGVAAWLFWESAGAAGAADAEAVWLVWPSVAATAWVPWPSDDDWDWGGLSYGAYEVVWLVPEACSATEIAPSVFFLSSCSFACYSALALFCASGSPSPWSLIYVLIFNGALRASSAN